MQNFQKFGNVRCLLICTFVILTCKSAIGFWPFSDNTPTTPTLKFYPEPTDANQNTLIYFKYFGSGSGSSHIMTHIDSIKRFLSSYEKTQYSNDAFNACGFNLSHPPNTFCVFDPRVLDRCGYEDFGYIRSSPCILLTMSKVENWTPIPFNESDIAEISDSNRTDTFSTMPKDLRDFIAEQTEKNMIWVSCNGDTSADVEFVGPIEYYPTRGFPTYYFPFTNVEGYQSPIVAVHFTRPMRGVVIGIECKLWAKNIKLDREKEIGYTRFHLLID